MKLVNNNISPLPFYDDIAQQNHRKSYAYGSVFPLITYKNFLLPFQFATDKSVSSFSYVRLYDFNTGDYTDIKQSMLDTGLYVNTTPTDCNVWRYNGNLPVNEIKHEGLYYIGILTNQGIWLYSDVFNVSNKVDDCLMLEYYNTYDLYMKNAVIDFSNGFKFKCYLKTQIGKPEYTFEEEVTERMGYSFIESQVSKKVYKFNFLAPEYLCDALRIVRLCDTKMITSLGQTYDLTTFAIEAKWEDQGDLAGVDAEFETDTVIANVGGYKPLSTGADFNIDYNEDYKIGKK